MKWKMDSMLIGAILTTALGPWLLACSDSNPCSISVSGARTGSYRCEVPSLAHYQVNADTFVMGVGWEGAPSTGLVLRFPGKPATGAYTHASPGAQAEIWYNETASDPDVFRSSVWRAARGIETEQGTFTLKLSSVALQTSTDASAGVTAVYAIHGTVDSSLSPKAGTNASGVLNVHVNF